MKIEPLRIFGFIMLVLALIVFMMFFKYVSIGEHVSKETYMINGELDFDSWLWNIGIFTAIIMGFYSLINMSIDFLFPKKEKENV